MTTPQPNPLAVDDFTIDGGDAEFVTTPDNPLWTVPGATPVRVDAISMTINYPGIGMQGDQYAISYQVPGGNLQFQQWTPVYVSGEATGNPELIYLTWMRMATGSDQLPPPVYTPQSTTPFAGYSTGTYPLPDIVLAPQTQILLFRGCGNGGGNVGVTVTGCTITYTEGTGPVSDTTGPQGVPLLTPTDNS